jgi:hypothetical protein
LRALGDASIRSNNLNGGAIVLHMKRAGQLLAVLAVPAIAIGVSGSVWAGVIIAAIELGCCGLLRSRRQPQ